MAAAWEAGSGRAPGTDENAPADPAYAAEVERRVDAVVDALCRAKGPTIVVTNEVGQGVVSQWASARLFRDVMGRANARLVGASDTAYLCVAGRALDIGHLPTSVSWPED
jgi:adenosylcobinamide kinase/adenosylcobinamide-phosphate guanylyltransferase